MTKQIRRFAWCASLSAVVAAVLAVGQARAAEADLQAASAEKQQRLIKILQSDAPPQDKAVPCKLLAVYGTKEAVPALAPLLLDKDLSSWARIALEAISDPASDEALRGALTKAQGRLLVGVINSIGVRRDAAAVPGLISKLKDADADVAAAAAVALGHIGGEAPAQALRQALADSSGAVRSAVAEGCMLCAEQFLAAKQFEAAIRDYDVVRKATLPKQRLLEATRGAILARQTAGLPLLLEQLHSADKAYFGIGLRTARELPGREVSEALAAELARFAAERQPMLLLALADRGDSTVLPAVLRVAKSGSKALRIAATGVLERLGNVSCLPMLLEAAADTDAELARPAQTVLARLSGKEVDSALLARLPSATGRIRQVLIELAGQRHLETALPLIVRSAEDADAGVRAAAVQAIGDLGQVQQAADLVRLLQKSQSSQERTDIEKSLLAISSRAGAGTVQYLLPLIRSGESAVRSVGIHALASVGGAEALAAVKVALADKDEAVQDEAVRTLSTWPSNWPDDAGVAEPLLNLAKSGAKLSHQVLGVRGYLQFVQGDKQFTNAERLAKISELLPVIKRPEEKRLAIAAIGAIPTAGALELLPTFATDPALAEDACSAIISLASRNRAGISRTQRQTALQTVVAKSQNDATKKRAEELLKGIR